MTTFVTEHWSGKIDCVVSPPPSLQRASQPAEIVAEGVAGSLGVMHKLAAVVKASTTPQMKNVTPQERARILGAAIKPGADSVAGMRVLIVDDLWQTGSTMRRVAEVLGAMGPGTRNDSDEMTMAPPSVFIAGSRKISRLPDDVRRRINKMIDKGLQILVGDANGADKAVQRYLADKGYLNVVVHCMESHCRNNVGQWPLHQVVAPQGAKGFDYYSVKDRVMAEAAEYGLMLWDGKSKGTINNVVSLSRRNKLVVVYVAPAKSFQTVRSFEDLKDVLAKGHTKSVDRVVHELDLDVPSEPRSGRLPETFERTE